MSPKDQDEISAAFARAVYACNLPHSLFEHPLWKAAFSKIRPCFKPPNKNSVGGKLLTDEYDKIQAASKIKIDLANALSVGSDGWKNVRGEHLLNFVVCTPEPVFHSVVEPKTNREDHKYIAGEIKKVINDVGPMKTFLAVTDNAPVMVAAGHLIEEEFPHITHVGCCAHALDLLIEDIVNLGTVSNIAKMCRALVKAVKNVPVNLSHFQLKQEEHSARTGKRSVSLKLPSPTRFAGVVILFHSVIANKEALQQTVVIQDLAIDREIKDIALSEDKFWSKRVAWHSVLQPIARVLAYVESNYATLSDAVEAFYVISVDSLQAFKSSPITKYRRKFEDCFEYRKSFVLKKRALCREYS